MNESKTAAAILAQVRRAVVGKDEVLARVLLAILAGGHILLEDIPGVGKTTMALAFSKALDELEEEGGIPARHRRYAENNRLLIEKMRAMGFPPYIDGSHQGPIITTFFYPAGVSFQFSQFYTYIKERGYVLYPGKLTDADTFRVGNIGEIYPEDIEKLASIIAGFLAAHKEEIA